MIFQGAVREVVGRPINGSNMVNPINGSNMLVKPIKQWQKGHTFKLYNYCFEARDAIDVVIFDGPSYWGCDAYIFFQMMLKK